MAHFIQVFVTACNTNVVARSRCRLYIYTHALVVLQSSISWKRTLIPYAVKCIHEQHKYRFQVNHTHRVIKLRCWLLFLWRLLEVIAWYVKYTHTYTSTLVLMFAMSKHYFSRILFNIYRREKTPYLPVKHMILSNIKFLVGFPSSL